MTVCSPQLKQYTEIPLTKTCFCPVLCLLLDSDSIVAQAAGMNVFSTIFALNAPFLERIFSFCFFLVNLDKEYQLKLMWVRPAFNVACKALASPCSWCISWFTCFMLVHVVTCRWTLKMNTFLFNRGVFATFEKEHWIKKEGGFCTFHCRMCIVLRVCLFVWSGKFGSLFSEILTAHFKHRDLNVMTFRASLEFSLTSWNTVEFSRDFYWVKAPGVFLAFHSRIHMAVFILDGCESLLEVNSRHFSWTQHNVNPVGNILQRRRVLASKRILIKRVSAIWIQTRSAWGETKRSSSPLLVCSSILHTASLVVINQR